MILYSDIFMLVIPYTNDIYLSSNISIPVMHLLYLYTNDTSSTSIPCSPYHAVIYLYTIYVYSLCYTYNTIPLYQWYTSAIALPQYQWYLYNLCIVPQLPVCCLQAISAPHHHAPHNTSQIADLFSRIYISREYLHCHHRGAKLYIFRAYRDLEAKNQFR